MRTSAFINLQECRQVNEQISQWTTLNILIKRRLSTSHLFPPTPHVIQNLQRSVNSKFNTTMSTGHQMLTYAICTHQQRTQILTILIQRIKTGKQEESRCFGLLVMGPTTLYGVITKKCFFFFSCRSVEQNKCPYRPVACLMHACENCMWPECGPWV